ncbi:hypothetical protein QQ045_014691 [Rhodiola kirilowii]
MCNAVGNGGVGIVARDHRAVVLAVRGMPVRSCHNALEIEGMALKEALILAMDLHLKNVIFETDCQNLVASINNKTDDTVLLLNLFGLKAAFYCATVQACHHLNTLMD